MIGRDEEMEILRRRWQRARNGKGQVVLVSGEPGIGKSRLGEAFVDDVKNSPHFLLRYQCSPHHVNSAFHPIIDQLVQSASIDLNDHDQEKLEKLQEWIGQWSEHVDEDLPYLASLFSLSSEEFACPVDLHPDQQRKRTLNILSKQVAKISEKWPVMCLFEDVHWSDPTTLEWLDMLVDRAERLRVLILVTFRPEFSPSWIGKAHTTLLVVGRFARDDVRKMIRAVIGESRLPADVLSEIEGKTDGIPLFIEELSRSVLERGRVTSSLGSETEVLSGAELRVPATLHDSLMSRLDHLGKGKEIAQIGAVIGREFSHELLAAISSWNEESLQDALSKLCDSGLVERRGTPPDLKYMFKHALVQDTAYQSLLKRTRQAFHRRIAETLEKHFPVTRSNEPELLAHHYTEAADDEKAMLYWHAAGMQSLGFSANEEAVRHFDRALSNVDSLEPSRERDEMECDLLLRRGAALTGLKGYGHEDVVSAYSRAARLCEQTQQPKQLFRALRGLWNGHNMRLDLEAGSKLAARLMALAEESQDRIQLLIANRAMGTSHITRGDVEAARTYLDRGVKIYDRDAHRPCILQIGEDPGLWCYVYSAWAIDWLGYRDRALGRTTEAIALAETLPSRYPLSYVLACAALFYQYRRDVQHTREFAERTAALSEEQGNAQQLAWATVHLGWVEAVQGNPDSGVTQIRQGVDSWRAISGQAALPHFLTLLADACRRAGLIDEGFAAIEEATDIVKRTMHRTYEVEVHRQRAELLMFCRNADKEDAEQAFLDAIEVARWQKTRTLELRAALGLARLWQTRQKLADARQLIARVYEGFTEGRDTLDLREAKAFLEKVAHS